MRKTKFLGLSVANAVGKAPIHLKNLRKSQLLGVRLEQDKKLENNRVRQIAHTPPSK
jgi:hypothetical protein